MWYRLARFILKYRLPLIVILIISTIIMACFAKQVKLSYEFTRAIPTDNQKYLDYLSFKQKFGADGNTMVIGFESDSFYTKNTFNAIAQLHQELKKIQAVEGIISIPQALNLVKDSSQKLIVKKIFNTPYSSQALLDSDKAIFQTLPFYKSILYNGKNNYLLAVTLNKDIINSKDRTVLINNILKVVNQYKTSTGIDFHISGLPFIRTQIADRIKQEMNYFLLASLLLSAIVLLLFFRSVSAMLLSLSVVIIGVVFSIATIVLCGYKITLLTALIPPLIVVIGIPNCIYFLNKYHASFKEKGNKEEALLHMVGRMGIVTLFCNIAAAIGFAVFAFTQSQLLKEFGIVAGINIMLLFFISMILITTVLSYLPPPTAKHTKYLDNRLLEKVLMRIERWTIHHQKMVYTFTVLILLISIAGIIRLKTEGFIVDDLPKQDVLYKDLKWFENNFEGIMPLEIVVDAGKKHAALKMETLLNVEELNRYIDSNPLTAKPLSLTEGLKFANQAFYNGDSNSYILPIEIPATLTSTLKHAGTSNNPAMQMLSKFLDSNQQCIRISVNMKDVGTKQLPLLMNDFQQKANQIFPKEKYKVTFTGSSVTFLEGSSFIIHGLRDSIFWAFLLIALCMLWLFKSARILFCSLIPNIIPLFITAGVMGWAGIAIKPSTVLVFSIALGIVIDVTIRFLINYRQELPANNNEVEPTIIKTIHQTGLSIIYTSLVLIAGFIIFCYSGFGGTKALGWLTSLTLVVGAITNLVLLPVLLLSFAKNKKSAH